MLQIRNLTITYKKDLRELISGFSLTVNQGDRIALIGEEGNGKSTLLRWIADPSLISGYAEAKGIRTVQNEKTGYLSQELEESDRTKSVYEYFCEEPFFAEKDPKELNRLAVKLHMDPGMYYSMQEMETLSGGEKIKIRMARILIAEPTVLLLDEPSNDLDLAMLEWLEEMIVNAPQAVVFVSHDESLIRAAANRIIHLELLNRKTAARHTVVSAGYDEYLERRDDLFERQMQKAMSERREDAMRMERFRRIQQRVEHEQRTISRRDPSGGRLLKKKMASVKATERRYEREHAEMTEIPVSEDAINVKLNYQRPLPAGRVVLELEMPELRAPDGRLLSRDLKLHVQGPEKLCIIGRNGAGKSTLLRQIRSLLEARENLHVCYMPQDYNELLDPAQTPVDFLAPSGDKAAVTEARSFLGAMHYTTQEMERPLGELSGGQRAKVLLLKLGLTETDVLLLDEPTRNFSPLSGPEIREMLRAFPGAILAVSHDRKFIAEVCDRVLILTENGLEAQRP